MRNLNDEVCERLRELVEVEGLTQAELAKRSGLVRSEVSKYLSGSTTMISTNLLKLCEGLGYSVRIEIE